MEGYLRCDRALQAVRAAHGEAGVKAVGQFLAGMGDKATIRWIEVGEMYCVLPCRIVAGFCEASASPKPSEVAHVD